MWYARNLPSGILFRKIEANLSIVYVFFLGDWEHIMEQGSWPIRDWAVLLEHFDEFEKVDLVALQFMPIWMIIHELHEICRNDTVVQQLASEAVKFLTI
jgi:hypothetical protein